jgi:hypothetical protein
MYLRMTFGINVRGCVYPVRHLSEETKENQRMNPARKPYLAQNSNQVPFEHKSDTSA